MEVAQQWTRAKSSRFNYIAYDGVAQSKQAEMKDTCQILEEEIEVMLPNSRAKALALTALEECYMWIGKAVRDDQIERSSVSAPIQEARTNS